MEPTKKPSSLKKRWLKRLTRYKISNGSATSADSQSSETSSQKNVVDQLDNRKSTRGGVFGSLRRVHNRVKLCVSKRKVRTLDTRSNTNAFHSNQSLEGQQVNCTTASNIAQVRYIYFVCCIVSKVACFRWRPLNRRLSLFVLTI